VIGLRRRYRFQNESINFKIPFNYEVWHCRNHLNSETERVILLINFLNWEIIREIYGSVMGVVGIICLHFIL
jgi:hypothetical protein